MNNELKGFQRWAKLVAKHHKKAKFVVIGAICFLINSVILYILTRLKLAVAPAQIIGYEAGLLFGFYANSKWTYKKNERSSLVSSLLKYHWASLSGLVLSTVIVVVLSKKLGLQPNVALLFASAIVMIWNYFLYDRFVFSKRSAMVTIQPGWIKKRLHSVQSLFTRQNTVKLLAATFFILYAYLFVFSILMPRYSEFNNTMLLDTCGALLLILGLVAAFRSNISDRVANLVARKRVLIPLFGLVFALHLYVAYALAIDPTASGWDPLTIFKSALSLDLSHKLPQDVLVYFQLFPNNLGVLGLLAGWLSLWGHLGVHNYIFLMLLLNTIILNAGLVMLYLCAREIAGKKAALFALLFGVAFITLSPWSRTYYSDTIGLFFTVTNLYAVLRLRRAKTMRQRILLSCVLGVVASLGYLIKPTTLFVIIAAAIIYSLRDKTLFTRSRHTLYTVGVGLCALACFGIVSLSLKAVIVQRTNLTLTTMPLSNFAFMGLSEVCTPVDCRYGAWNMPDALKQGTFNTLADYTHYTHVEIKQRLKTYGIGGYISFASQKGAWIVGDGTFYAYNEGLEKTAPLLHTNSSSHAVQQIMHPSGRFYTLYINVVQTIWITILLAMLAPFFLLKRRVYDSETLVIYISLLGLLVFLLLFEARSRYLYLYVPLFTLAAIKGLESLAITKPKG